MEHRGYLTLQILVSPPLEVPFIIFLPVHSLVGNKLHLGKHRFVFSFKKKVKDKEW